MCASISVAWNKVKVWFQAQFKYGCIKDNVIPILALGQCT
jgi:hypothetical protein